MRKLPKIIPVRLSEDQWSRTEAEAARLEMPASTWIRQAIREKLERDHAE